MVYLRITFITVFLILVIVASVSAAVKFKPAVIYQGDIQKNSYNYTIHEGVKEFERTTGQSVKEIVVSMDSKEYMAALNKICEDGFSPVALIYADYMKNITSFVRQHSGTRFLALGKLVDESNLFTFQFAEHEGSFLAGALAAMASKSDIIGFVSVSDIPATRRFACGYKQGAKYIKPDIKVLTGFVGHYTGAWYDGKAAAALADKLMDQNADVIYQVAGGAGVAVLEAAAKRGILSIGVDRNQNGLYPGYVLSSMYKKVDRVIYAALKHSQKGIWRDNSKSFGVAQDAVGLSFDENNAPLITPEMRRNIEDLKRKIAIGEIQIHDFILDNTCPW